LYNLIGDLIYTQQLNKEVSKINISPLPKGIYVYKLDGNQTGKIVVD
jgi:hypothetical protein